MDKQQTLKIDDRYVVSLENWEGPLDLLLHLISIHELDIFDIPIAFVTKKYLEYLDLMQELNLNLASEYLEMAAQLTYIKSKMMVPDDPLDVDDEFGDDGSDPREELIRQLLEYQKYKTAADELLTLPQAGRDTFLRGTAEELSHEESQLASPGLFALMKALQKVIDNLDDESINFKEILVTQISISARINQIYDVLRQSKRISFIKLFEDHATRSDVVVTFLAILEMTKLGLVSIHQAGPCTEIHISASVEEAEANRLMKENKIGDS